MNCDLQLHLHPPETSGEDIRLSCSLELPGKDAYDFWFLLPAAWAPAVSPAADAYVLISLFTAMKHGGCMHIHGELSPLLLRNLPDVVNAWCRWYPYMYKPLVFQADTLKARPPEPAPRVLMPFSGGLDSCHTLWRFIQTHDTPNPPITAFMAHGFDIPLDDPQGFEAAYQNSCRILDSVNVDALRIRSNVRQHRNNWGHMHGAALAACLQLMSGTFNRGLIAGSHSYDTLRFPWGSNPLIDPMFSSEAMSINYDGLCFSRNDKAREVANWPAAMQNIRTCWTNSDHASNCGHCLRCIATALTFAAEGVEPPEALNVGPLLPALKGLRKKKWTPEATQRIEDSIMAPALRNGIQAPWLFELIRILRFKKRQAAVRRLGGSVLRFVRPLKIP